MSVIVQSNSIKVYSNCPIEVDSLTAQADCVKPTTFGTDSTTPVATAVEGGFGIMPIAGVGGVVLIAIIILAAVVACTCVHRRKKKRKSTELDLTPCREVDGHLLIGPK